MHLKSSEFKNIFCLEVLEISLKENIWARVKKYWNYKMHGVHLKQTKTCRPNGHAAFLIHLKQIHFIDLLLCQVVRSIESIEARGFTKCMGCTILDRYLSSRLFIGCCYATTGEKKLSQRAVWQIHKQNLVQHWMLNVLRRLWGEVKPSQKLCLISTLK